MIPKTVNHGNTRRKVMPRFHPHNYSVAECPACKEQMPQGTHLRVHLNQHVRNGELLESDRVKFVISLRK